MLGMLLNTHPTELTADLEVAIADDVRRAVTAKYGDKLLRPTAEVKTQIAADIRDAVNQSAHLRSLRLSVTDEARLIDQIIAQITGLGFLDPILAAGDVIEVTGNPDGSWWVMRRGASAFTPIAIHPSPVEVRSVLDKVLGPLGRRVTEAEPIVIGKLPPSPQMPAGARLNVVAPPIANGPYPAVNLRFYEARPVQRDLIVDQWRMLSPELWDFLTGAIQGQARILISGGTGSGKTTLLSALANTIPPTQRVLLCEDPSEIFLDHPQVVRLEGRPATAEGKYEVAMGALVTTALRMTPRWLVVGEIRSGAAALWLFRAQMSDHPGLSTLHSDSPASALGTLCLLGQLTEEHVPFSATKYLTARAVDLIVQIGYDATGRRRVKQVVQVEPELRHAEVVLTPLWDMTETHGEPYWTQVGDFTRRRSPG